MTREERIEVGKAYMAVGFCYGADISQQRLAAVLNALEDLPHRLVIEFLNNWSKQAKFARPPFPSEIRLQLVGVPPDDDQVARDIATRMIGAVRRHGHNNPDDAREFMGEIGWQIIRRMGGWDQFSRNLMNDQHPTYLAQFRELAKGMLVNERYEDGKEILAIGGVEKRMGLQSFGSLLSGKSEEEK
jgi:hypothetical protein